ncbi:MAG: MarR family winged helix-turn-helix transcriptional regulator [Flammeovirgaceae bacterium]
MLAEEIKQKKFVNSHQKMAINILYTSGWLKRKVQATLKPFGITHAQYNVLRILNGKCPNPCNPSEITEVMIEKMSDVTRLLDRLKSKGLVDRCICEHNRRKVDVYITEQGKQLLREIDPVMEKGRKQYQSLSPEEAELLSDLLDKLRAG